MDLPIVTLPELVARCDVGGGEPDGPPVLLVDLATGPGDRGADIGGGDMGGVHRFVECVTAWPWVVVGVGSPETHDAPLGRAMDVVFDHGDPALDRLIENVAAQPIAACALVLLLRSSESLPPVAGLVAESTTYSTLQAGPEFNRWRTSTPRAPSSDGDGPTVRVEEHGSELHVVLDRPARHNAIDPRLRLELHDALRVAHHARRTVVLRGEGPSFSSGGDLDEFGSFSDPATAHLVRLRNHPAIAMVELGPGRTRAVVHGACLGGGLELAAFAGHVTAHPDTWFQLPELGLGLIPGAGGTVSVARRIGRRRTARLALTLERLDAATALDWHLIDAIDATGAPGATGATGGHER